MILEIPEMLREIAPGLPVGGTPSVICVRTTRPKYLIFGDRADYPVAIADFGTKGELEQLHRILSRIHRKAPDLVAEPIALAPWKNGLYVHLQSGLAGTPWFRIGEALRSLAQWHDVAVTVRDALTRLHDVVASFPDWVRPVRPGAELRTELATCMASGAGLSELVLAHAERSAVRLDALGEFDACFQHGDFCLNNVLVAPGGVRIIDFEEFGRTAMPLLDDVGLAMSLDDLMPRDISRRFDPMHFLATTRAPQALLDRQCLSASCMHHFLWRINQCRDSPTRAPARRALLEKVEQMAAAA